MRTKWSIRSYTDGWYLFDDVGPFDGPYASWLDAWQSAWVVLRDRGVAYEEMDLYVEVWHDQQVKP